MRTSQKAEVTHHFSLPLPVISFPSLPGTEPFLCLAAHVLPARPLLHRSSLMGQGRRGPEVNTLLRHLDVEEVRSAGTEAQWLPQKAGAGRDDSSEGHLEVRTEGWGRLAHPCMTLRVSLRRLAALVQLLRLEGGGRRLSFLPSAL